MTLVSVPALMEKFRSGTCNGHWLAKSEVVLQDKMVRALGQTQSVSSTTSVLSSKSCFVIRQELFSVPGFQQLNWLMPSHVDIPESYFLVIAMVLGRTLKDLPEEPKFDMDTVWNHVFGGGEVETGSVELSSRISLSGDAMITILGMVRPALFKCYIMIMGHEHVTGAHSSQLRVQKP